jgi:predicted amidohydrolase
MVRLASTAGADLVLLPELSALPVDCPPDMIAMSAQTCDGFLTQRFIRLAQESNCMIAFGYPELHNGTLKNSFGVVGPSGHMGNVQKVNLFGWDNTWAEPASIMHPILALPTMRIGVLIGRDVMNTDLRRMAELYPPGSVDLILLPTRWVGEYSFPDSAWVDLGKKVHCAVAVSNIVADSTFARYRGGACVIDKCGRISIDGFIPGGDCFVMGDV